MTWRPLRQPQDGDDEGRPPRPLGDSLGVVARHLGAPPPEALSRLFQRWDELVGPAVAAHSRPVSLRGGTLVVAVDQPGWAAQLGWLSDDLVRRLAGTLGPDVVTELVIRVRPPGPPERDAAPERPSERGAGPERPPERDDRPSQGGI